VLIQASTGLMQPKNINILIIITLMKELF